MTSSECSTHRVVGLRALTARRVRIFIEIVSDEEIGDGVEQSLDERLVFERIDGLSFAKVEVGDLDQELVSVLDVVGDTEDD
jgi:hypothetical protein